MIIIRDASTNDIKTIQDIAEQTWWPTYSPILEKEQIEFMLSSMYSEEALVKAFNENNQSFLLLEDNNVAKAFASYGKWDEDPKCFKIPKLYVLPGHQGKGYGKQLITEIVSKAEAAGKNSIILNVNRFNPALNFYQKIGFRIIREVDIPIGPYWMNDYVMKLDIKP